MNPGPLDRNWSVEISSEYYSETCADCRAGVCIQRIYTYLYDEDAIVIEHSVKPEELD